MNLRFVGTTEIELNVDPEEFRGLNVEDTVNALAEMLDDEYPEVDIPFDDVVMAADELVTAACES